MAEELERLATLEANIRNIFHQLDELEENVGDLHRLTTAVEKLATQGASTAKAVDKIDKRLAVVERMPGEEAQHYRRLIIGAICSGIIGALIGAIMGVVLR